MRTGATIRTGLARNLVRSLDSAIGDTIVDRGLAKHVPALSLVVAS